SRPDIEVRTILFLYGLYPLQPLEHVSPGFCLLGLLSRDITPDELLGPGNHLLLLLILARHGRASLISLSNEGGVVALIHRGRSPVDVDNFGSCFVQQESVMGDDYERALVLRKKPL